MTHFESYEVYVGHMTITGCVNFKLPHLLGDFLDSELKSYTQLAILVYSYTRLVTAASGVMTRMSSPRNSAES